MRCRRRAGKAPEAAGRATPEVREQQQRAAAAVAFRGKKRKKEKRRRRLEMGLGFGFNPNPNPLRPNLLYKVNFILAPVRLNNYFGALKIYKQPPEYFQLLRI